MLDFFRGLFSTGNFMPHGMCYLWDPAVLWLNVVSDVLIAASYYAIPILLFRFVRNRRDLSFNWIFVAFGAFILACGTTHLLAAVTVWKPVYWLDGLVKAVTAAASMSSFLLLIPLLPTLVKLPSPSELSRINRTLEQQVAERRAAEEQVRRVNSELEERVAVRTAELADSEAFLRRANDDLQREMGRRRHTEDQLVQSQKMEAIGRLAGGVAHDFNNLLTAILGYNELLRSQLKDDPVAGDYANEVARAAERASGLTNQLLAFSRRQMAAPRRVDLNQVVGGIERMLRRIIGEDIELHINLAPDLRPVLVDPSHMDQVIMNLAVNSRDAMPEGGRLTIETGNVELGEEYAGTHLGAQPGHYVMLAVSDTGHGMDAATKSHLFEPFFTTKEKGKGTGLGLSIVYGIVKQNGGDILVYSEPGHGTVFKIYLPAVDAPATEPGSEGTAEGSAPAHGSILLVEDEEQVRSLTKTMLQRLGYEVTEAASGPEALQLVKDGAGKDFDLLLTDVVMPRMSGPDLAKEIGRIRPGTRVLYMSGYTDTTIIQQGAVSSEAAFIQKPFTAHGLAAKVREALGNSAER